MFQLRALWRFSLITLGTVLLGVAITGCGRSQAAPSAAMAPLVTVTDVTVSDVPYYIDEIGRCAASNSVTLMPQVAGRIEDAKFTEGMDVKKGEVLYTIDPRPFQAAVDQAQAALEQNQENLRLAQVEFARVEALKGTNAVPQTEYDEKKSAVAVAQATVEAAQATLETAKLNLEYCQIKSPLNGRTGMRMVDPGNVVKANETGLVMVQSFDPMYVEFTIPEDRLAEVRDNMSRGTLKTLVDFSTVRGQVIAATSSATQPSTQPVHVGELSMVDNAVQANSGTVRLRAIIPNADRFFWPGQFVHVRLVLHENKDALLVPSQAIQVGQQGPYVYVVKHDEAKKADLAEMRPIVQGQIQGDLIVIEKGLKQGEKVITTGQMMVVPDAPVTVAAAPATASTKPGEIKS